VKCFQTGKFFFFGPFILVTGLLPADDTFSIPSPVAQVASRSGSVSLSLASGSLPFTDGALVACKKKITSSQKFTFLSLNSTAIQTPAYFSMTLPFLKPWLLISLNL
jgi:hypothetical protein